MLWMKEKLLGSLKTYSECERTLPDSRKPRRHKRRQLLSQHFFSRISFRLSFFVDRIEFPSLSSNSTWPLIVSFHSLIANSPKEPTAILECLNRIVLVLFLSCSFQQTSSPFPQSSTKLSLEKILSWRILLHQNQADTWPPRKTQK